MSMAGGTHLDCNIEIIKQQRSGSIGLKSFSRFVIACFNALHNAWNIRNITNLFIYTGNLLTSIVAGSLMKSSPISLNKGIVFCITISSGCISFGNWYNVSSVFVFNDENRVEIIFKRYCERILEGSVT